jgi:uncharacterized membrane protein
MPRERLAAVNENRGIDPASDQGSRNIRTVAELEEAHRADSSPVDRFVDRVAAFAGRPLFVVAHIVWFGIWIAVNTGPNAFDPFPFSLLTMVVSLEAILLSAFVLIAQNRMTAQAERRAQLDLQINLLAEQELTAILRALVVIGQKTGVDLVQVDPWIQEFQRTTDVQKLNTLLEEREQQRDA